MLLLLIRLHLRCSLPLLPFINYTAVPCTSTQSRFYPASDNHLGCLGAARQQCYLPVY